MRPLPFTLHLALSTFPQKNKKTYHEFLLEFYNNYRKESEKLLRMDEKKYDKLLFRPLIYHMFGSYDVGVISLIDTLNFAQKLFFPTYEDGNNCAVYPAYFQVYTGILQEFKSNYNFDFKKCMEKTIESKPKYMAVCSLKVNNGFLLGNGNILIYPLIRLIDNLIRDLSGNENHIIMQSFNWSELCVILFDNDRIENLAKIIQQIRNLTFTNLNLFLKSIPSSNSSKEFESIVLNDLQLEIEKIHKKGLSSYIRSNSLYNKIRNINLRSEYENSHLFVDSHSHFGVHLKTLLKGNGELLKDTRCYIETHIKPGHFKYFNELLNENEFNIKANFISGSTDYTITAQQNEMFDLLKFTRLIKDENKNIEQHVRKTKTRILFDPFYSTTDKTDVITRYGIVDFSDTLNSCAYSIQKICEIKNQLKSLKISRSLRERIIKAFYNYNNGIQDPVLYNFYIDFKGFLEHLRRTIKFYYKNNQEYILRGYHSEAFNKNVGYLESVLLDILNIFDDAYAYRFLNTSTFENIHDFNIDFNSSVQQLITVYDNISKMVARSFFYSNDLPLTTINEIRTKSNQISINYNVFHLLEPGHIFAILIKELLNPLLKDKTIFLGNSNSEAQDVLERINRFNKLFDNQLRELVKNEFDKHLQEFDKHLQEFDIDYLVIDFIRFGYTFNFDWELYRYWYWHTALQNSSFYSTLGIMEYQSFLLAMFRLLLFYKVFIDIEGDGWSNSQLNSPLPELSDHWEKSFSRLTKLIDKICFILDDDIKEFVRKSSAMMGYIFRNDFQLNNEKQRNITTKKFKRNESAINVNVIKEMILDKVKFKFENDFADRCRHVYQAQINLTKENQNRNISDIASVRFEIVWKLSKEFELQLRNIDDVEYICKVPFLYNFRNYLSPVLYYNALSLAYLRWIKMKNNGSIHLLRRCHKTGKPLVSFSTCQTENSFVYIDPLGSNFIIGALNRETYMKARNKVLNALIHLGYIIKRDFLTKQRD